MPRVSPLKINLQDSLTPYLATLVKKFPEALKITVRRTAGHFRRQLMMDIGKTLGTSPTKKKLRGAVEARVRSKKSKSAYRSLHSSSRPWVSNSTANQFYVGGRKVPALAKAVRYGATTRDELNFNFGFTGETYNKDYTPRGRISKTAVIYAKAVTEGLFFNWKTRQFSNNVTDSMRRHMGARGVGISKSKSRLNYKPRPVVEPFFFRNRQNMVKYFNRTFSQEVSNLDKKTRRIATGKTRRIKIA